MELKELSYDSRSENSLFQPWTLLRCRSSWICCCQTCLMKSNASLITVLFGLYVKSSPLIYRLARSVCSNLPRPSGYNRSLFSRTLMYIYINKGDVGNRQYKYIYIWYSVFDQQKIPFVHPSTFFLERVKVSIVPFLLKFITDAPSPPTSQDRVPRELHFRHYCQVPLTPFVLPFYLQQLIRVPLPFSLLDVGRVSPVWSPLTFQHPGCFFILFFFFFLSRTHVSRKLRG